MGIPRTWPPKGKNLGDLVPTLSDLAFYSISPYGQLSEIVLFWANIMNCLYQAVNVRHHKVGEVVEPAMYRINDDLVTFTQYWVQSFSFSLTFSLLLGIFGGNL